MHKKHWIIVIHLVVFFLLATIFNILVKQQQQFTHLAESFLSGRLDFTQEGSHAFDDAALYNARVWWHMGPFPAVALMLPVLFGQFLGVLMQQGYVQIFLLMGVFYFAHSLAKKHKYSHVDALYLAFAFCFSSVALSILFVPWSWYFSQIVALTLVMTALYEYFHKKRYLVVGMLMALVLMTRATAALGILFFLIEPIVRYRTNWSQLSRIILQLTAPMVFALILLGVYNFMRFGDIFTTGYLLVGSANASFNRFELDNFGLFQLRNIPTNFYYYFIHTLDPVRIEREILPGLNTHVLKAPYIQVWYPGTSFFVVSPIFLYIFATVKNKWQKSQQVRAAATTSGVIIFVLLTYYWSGAKQVGPRYMIDALPFLYLLLLCAFKNHKLTTVAYTTIILSAWFNLYLFMTTMTG